MGIQILIDKTLSSLGIFRSRWLLLCFIILTIVKITAGSYGDRSYIFLKCVSNCGNTNCTNQSKFLSQQPWYLWLLQWSCKDECRYDCMWKTVDAFRKDGSGVPQFYGKWPFFRLLGIQEPASVLFSILNGIWHLRIFTYRKLVPARVPMYYIWHIYALIGLNAWFWSAVFHTKDTDFTEKMDYFCAFSLVLSNYYAVLCRLFGTTPFYRPLGFAVLVIVWYAYHVYDLAFVHFDYGYNMKVNVFIGVLNFVGWMTYAFRVGIRKPHVRKCILCMCGLTFLVSLELLDFPPSFWTFDAHSMWHAGTAHFVIYGTVIKPLITGLFFYIMIPISHVTSNAIGQRHDDKKVYRSINLAPCCCDFIIEDGLSLAEESEDTSKKEV